MMSHTLVAAMAIFLVALTPSVVRADTESSDGELVVEGETGIGGGLTMLRVTSTLGYPYVSSGLFARPSVRRTFHPSPWLAATLSGGLRMDAHFSTSASWLAWTSAAPYVGLRAQGVFGSFRPYAELTGGAAIALAYRGQWDAVPPGEPRTVVPFGAGLTLGLEWHSQTLAKGGPPKVGSWVLRGSATAAGGQHVSFGAPALGMAGPGPWLVLLGRAEVAATTTVLDLGGGVRLSLEAATSLQALNFHYDTVDSTYDGTGATVVTHRNLNLQTLGLGLTARLTWAS